MSVDRQPPPLPRDFSVGLENEIDLGSLWQGIRQRLPATVLGALLVAGSVYTWVKFQPPVYEATATLLASSSQSQIGVVGGSVVSSLPPATVAEVVQSSLILQPLIQAVGTNPAIAPDERRRLATQLTQELLLPVTAGSGSKQTRTVSIAANQGNGENSVYQVHGRAQTPQAAQALANLTSDLLIDWDADRTLQDVRLARENFTLQLSQTERRLALPGLSALERQTLTYRRATMQDNLAQLAFLERSRPGVLKPLTGAAAPSRPVTPSPLRSAVLVGVLALLLGTAVAALLTALDRRARNEADLLALGFPVLETLPRFRGVAGFRQAGTLDFLRINLRALVPAPHSIVLVSGIAGGEGASTLTAALARSLAAGGERVLILDADLRHERQQELWPVESGDGAQTWHALAGAGGAQSLRAALQAPDDVQVRRVAPRIDLLPAGEAAQGGLGSADLGEHLRRWSQDYDLVLVDSPPLLTQADGVALAQRADGVLLVTEAGRTLLPELRRVLGRLQLAGGPVLGFVLNKAGRGLRETPQASQGAPRRAEERRRPLEDVR